MKTAKELTREWFDRVWNHLDRSAIEELMDPECEILGLTATVRGPRGFLSVHESFTKAFDQIHVELVELVAEENEVAGHARFGARHRESQRQVDMMFSFSGKFENGRLKQVHHVVDYTSLLAQLNLFDPRRIGVVFSSGQEDLVS
jgi:predicted ester cyclase